MSIKFKYFVIILISLFFNFAHGQDKGLDAFEKKDFITAIKELKPFADSGHRLSQFALGMIYDQGNDKVPQDQSKAIKWYKLAANSNDKISGTASMYVGAMYLAGQGIPKNFEMGIKWLEKAYAKGEHLNSSFELGKTFLDNNFGKADTSIALKWFEKSSLVGNTRAMGLMVPILMGLGFDNKEYLIKAYAWSHIAAQNDPVQKMTTARYVIEKYMTKIEIEKGKKLKEKLITDIKTNLDKK